MNTLENLRLIVCSGVKPIGHWVVRRERRGLVCLVIDNRHIVERLECLEEADLQAASRSLTNERPITFADIFPLPVSLTSNRQRDESPERKFVVSFPSHTARDDVCNEDDRDICRPPKQTALSEESDLGEGSSSQQSSSGRRLEPTTSQLILEVIPHKMADNAIRPMGIIAGSCLLEAKAEEIIDTLMRQWTYVKPEYFLDDDQSSLSSTEALPSFPFNYDKSQVFQESDPVHDEAFSQYGHSYKGLGPLKATSSFAQGATTKKSPAVGIRSERTKPALGSRKAHAKKKDGDTISTPPMTDTRSTILEWENSSAGNPSSPAPPYSSQTFQCPNCHPSRLADPSMNKLPVESESEGGRTARKTSVGGKEDLNLPHGAMEAIGLLSELLRRPALPTAGPEGWCSHLEANLKKKSAKAQVPETNPLAEEAGRQKSQAYTIKPGEDDLVTLKDCLGRRFIFPIHTCRSWQVSHLSLISIGISYLYS